MFQTSKCLGFFNVFLHSRFQTFTEMNHWGFGFHFASLPWFLFLNCDGKSPHFPTENLLSSLWLWKARCYKDGKTSPSVFLVALLLTVKSTRCKLVGFFFFIPYSEATLTLKPACPFRRCKLSVSTSFLSHGFGSLQMLMVKLWHSSGGVGFAVPTGLFKIFVPCCDWKGVSSWQRTHTFSQSTSRQSAAALVYSLIIAPSVQEKHPDNKKDNFWHRENNTVANHS